MYQPVTTAAQDDSSTRPDEDGDFVAGMREIPKLNIRLSTSVVNIENRSSPRTDSCGWKLDIWRMAAAYCDNCPRPKSMNAAGTWPCNWKRKVCWRIEGNCGKECQAPHWCRLTTTPLLTAVNMLLIVLLSRSSGELEMPTAGSGAWKALHVMLELFWRKLLQDLADHVKVSDRPEVWHVLGVGARSF